MEFKRVDQVWDSKIRDYKYTESAEEKKDEFDSVFTVRRRFGWDNKYLETHVDIKSKVLRNALQVVFKDCKSISLVEDKPSVSVIVPSGRPIQLTLCPWRRTNES